MADNKKSKKKSQVSAQFEQAVKVLANTPPISNKELVKRAKAKKKK